MPDGLCLCLANVSCFRLQACFRQNQFDLPSLPCILSLLLSLNPADGMWGPRGGFSVGSVLIPEGHLQGFRIIESFRLEKSLSPTINLMLPGLPLNYAPEPRVLCQGLKIHPMMDGNHSSFLKRRPGGVLWSLAGMFCKSPLGSHLKSIKATLAVAWHSLRQLWQRWIDTNCST